MIPHETIEKVKKLIARGYSKPRIAEILNISRSTFTAIKTNKRPNYKQIKPVVELSIITKVIGRCPECGAKVYMPCVACNLKKVKNDRYT